MVRQNPFRLYTYVDTIDKLLIETLKEDPNAESNYSVNTILTQY